jgi:hypothetical protein
MPRYDYKCACGYTHVAFVDYEDRLEARRCPKCYYPSAEYQFPFTAAQGFQPFDAHYNEALDCDVHGRRELQQILKIEGRQEAGDKRGGARLCDENMKNSHAQMLGKQPLRGVSFSENRRQREEAKKQAKDLYKRLDVRGDISP